MIMLINRISEADFIQVVKNSAIAFTTTGSK